VKRDKEELTGIATKGDPYRKALTLYTGVLKERPETII